MASRNRVGRLIAAHMLDNGLTYDEFGALVGVSGQTIRRMVDPETYGECKRGHRIETKFNLAKVLREDPSALWPPITAKRKVAA